MTVFNALTWVTISCPPIHLSDRFRYQFTALIHLKHFQHEYEEARLKDAQLLQSKISLYARSTEEAFRELNIRQRGMQDALIAMQRVSTFVLLCDVFMKHMGILSLAERHSSKRR
jgi:hypothetical protein